MPKISRGKRVKKVKDPNAPKRAMSAYMYFVKETRQKIIEENTELKFQEISIKLAEKWKALLDVEKAPYLEKETQSKLAYVEACKKYNESKSMQLDEPEGIPMQSQGNELQPEVSVPPQNTQAPRIKTVKKRNKRDPNAPKRPLTAYMIYAQEIRPLIRQNNPNMGITELTAIIAANYSKLSVEQKQTYTDKAIQLKNEYLETKKNMMN